MLEYNPPAFLICSCSIIGRGTLIREAYIICEADIILSSISSVPLGTDIIEKSTHLRAFFLAEKERLELSRRGLADLRP